MVQKKVKESKHVVKHRRIKKHLSSSVWFIAIAFTAALGYVAGVYHYQIEAAIGPVFGYKVHSGNIDLSSVQQTYNKLAANFDGNLDTNKLIQGANSGLVDAAGDTYTMYMDPQKAKDYNDTLSGNIGAGIGAEIGLKNGNITIIRTLSGNAAIKAGLQANDVILKINDQSTSGWTVENAVKQIKGEEGTTVKLTILRGTETKDYTITRATIDIPSVNSSVTDGIGTLTISRFDNETGDLARQEAQDFKKQGVKAVILDLRNNGGGYIETAKDVAGLWLDNKVVVTEKRGSVVKDTLRTGNNAILAGIPTIVLVNGSSASASEIVAGALQDYKVAKLVGDNTFGKGSVQELMPLNDGAELKVTIAKWYTPNGNNIANGGIKPDVVVSYTQQDVDSGNDPQLNEANKLLNQ